MKSCAMLATAERGTPLIVGDADLQDRYIADLMKVERVPLTERNPIVKVRFVLCYPIQHAIIWTDIPHENAPVDDGIICRLQFFGFPDADQLARFATYAESLKAAQEEALQRAAQSGDRITEEIILRHMRGEYSKRRFLTTYKRWEI